MLIARFCAPAAAAAFLLLQTARIDAQGIAPAQQGFATFYGGPQDNTSPFVPSFGLASGACGYGLLEQADWPYWQATAIGPTNSLFTGGNKRGCGACIQITCTAGCMATAAPFSVLVTDTCDTCAPAQLNVHSLAFSKFLNADLSIGQVDVQWQQVDCTPPGDIKAKVVDFRAGEGDFIAVALLQVAGNGVISALDIQSVGQADWSPMINDHGAVWQASNLAAAPYSLRITGSNQQQLIATGAITQLANGSYSTGVQIGGVTTVGASSQSSSSFPPPQSAPASPPFEQTTVIPPPVPVIVPPVISPAQLVPPQPSIILPPVQLPASTAPQPPVLQPPLEALGSQESSAGPLASPPAENLTVQPLVTPSPNPPVAAPPQNFTAAPPAQLLIQNASQLQSAPPAASPDILRQASSSVQNLPAQSPGPVNPVRAPRVAPRAERPSPSPAPAPRGAGISDSPGPAPEPSTPPLQPAGIPAPLEQAAPAGLRMSGTPPALPPALPPAQPPVEPALPQVVLPPQAVVIPLPALSPVPEPAPTNVTVAALRPAAAPTTRPTAPAPRPASSRRLAPAPARSPEPRRGRAPVPAPARRNAPRPARAPSPTELAPATGPGTTSLTLNSSLNGAAATATNTIVNPAISVSGRRLRTEIL